MSELSNKLYGKFGIIHEGTSELEASAFIIYKSQSDLKSIVRIPPNNRMFGKFDVKAPPRITQKLHPTQDAFVRSGVPTLNYGRTGDLYVGSVNGEKFRSFLQFNIDEIPEKSRITKAKLILHVANFDSDFEGLELSTIDRHWEEYGVTWAGQPSRQRFINIINVDRHEQRIEFDVKDIVDKWYKGESVNYGLLLKAIDESIEQSKRLYSRETSYTKPVLEVEYFDLNIPSYGSSEIVGSINIKRHDYSELESKITVNSYLRQSDLKTKFHLHNQDILECKVTIAKRFIDSSVSVRQSNDMHVLFTPRFKGIDEIPAKFYPNCKILTSKVTVRQSDESILDSKVAIRQSSNNGVQAKANISNPRIYSKVTIRQSDSVRCYVSIRQKRFNTLQGKVNISRRYIHGNVDIQHLSDLFSRVNVIYAKHSDLSSGVVIQREDESIIEGKLNTRATSELPAEVFVLSPYMRARVTVRQSGYKQIVGIFDTRQSGDLKGNVDIRHYLNLKGNMNVRVRWFSEIPGKIQIGGETKRRAYGFIL